MKRLGTDTQTRVARAKPNYVDWFRMVRFARDEDGALSIFSLFMFFMILMAGGVGVDLMMNEMKRTKLQHTLDRAVLAAADLDQTLEPTAVVNDYFAKAGMGNYLQSVDVDTGLNFKEVSATAETVTDTIFMNLLGINSLSAPASGTAEERIGNVEISMVLDISGSMGWNNKIANLRNAGQTFVNTVIKPETEDLISISIVPYTAQVNAGPLIYDKLNVNHKHNYSHCLEWNSGEFDDTEIDLSRTWEQGQHFESSSNYPGTIQNPGCPKRSYERITSFSQNASALNSQISSLRARANTSIHLGMKWGTAMLDPTFRPIVSQLIAEGEVDSEFSGRPADYTDPETLKTIILMTDGQNVTTRRIKEWAYNASNEYYHWSRYPLWYYLNNYVPSYQHSNFYFTKYTPSQGDTYLDQTCDAAKAAGIVVWSIGFETGEHGSDVMEQCASSPAHFFEVEGSEIVDAFQSIARQINQLRLIQ
nr:TadE/TadG family type IV pilus assembly protein [Pseudaestuariivita atlantica]